MSVSTPLTVWLVAGEVTLSSAPLPLLSSVGASIREMPLRAAHASRPGHTSVGSCSSSRRKIWSSGSTSRTCSETKAEGVAGVASRPVRASIRTICHQSSCMARSSSWLRGSTSSANSPS